MLENRAFDHIIGYLKANNSDIDGLTGQESCPYNPKDLSEGSVKVNNTAPYITDPDPDHSFQATRDQVFGYGDQVDPAPMNGFVLNYFKERGDEPKGAGIMNCFSPKNVSATSTLAMEFALFDKWFSGIPGPTIPNRMFFHSATSYGAVNDNIENIALGYPQKPIYDSLEEGGVSWSVYYSDVPDVLVLERMRDPLYIDNIRELHDFYDDLKSDNLASYSFINPAYFAFFDYKATDMHPPHDVLYAEYLLADVYDALRASPYWNNTLFIVTYDEHGGLFDHVPPPQKGVPAPDDHKPPKDEPFFNFEMLGVRVPTIMASPFINKRTVIHEPSGPSKNHYCHSSLSKTLKDIHNLPSDYLTKRDAWAASFADIVDARSTPRTDTPKRLPRPGTKAQQEEWARISKRRMTPEVLSELITSTPPASDPISDLQRDMMAIVAGINGFDDMDGLLTKAEMDTIKEEQHGAIFVKKQMMKYRKRMKQQQQ